VTAKKEKLFQPRIRWRIFIECCRRCKSLRASASFQLGSSANSFVIRRGGGGGGGGGSGVSCPSSSSADNWGAAPLDPCTTPTNSNFPSRLIFKRAGMMRGKKIINFSSRQAPPAASTQCIRQFGVPSAPCTQNSPRCTFGGPRKAPWKLLQAARSAAEPNVRFMMLLSSVSSPPFFISSACRCKNTGFASLVDLS
jgi:hypothetical protein